ncbi:DUF2283 domain-containing protein [Candidatus Magnetomoraceae bacterium gMMP-15]
MYPHMTYDKENGLAYIAFSGNEIERSIESEDELFVLDIGKNSELVGIEILSIPRLQKKFAKLSYTKEEKFSPDMIPAYVIPFVISSHEAKKYADFIL